MFEKEISGQYKFLSTASGTFNIYKYDCPLTDAQEDEIVETLSGVYGIYYDSNMTVVFVKLDENGKVI